ncbi:unnamed protein product [Rhizoctonia solani]|uniref:Uncharacterized protein n=1 Tax=Rhizoctonia solani TaxID=456999 RepID=A0A8H3DKF5_9AGAM|nr:unnamed protein product [Rhizoctonia solani]
MLIQRAIPVLRQVTRSGYARMQSTQATDRKAKLVFRFGPKDVPVELWPMAAVVCAGVLGGGFAISRHFYRDEDLRLGKSPVAK